MEVPWSFDVDYIDFPGMFWRSSQIPLCGPVILIMQVPWSFDVDYTDLSRYVLKALCPYLVVLLYERCRFHGGSMEFPWRFNADSNGISKILLFLLANVNDQKIWMEHHLTTFWFFTGSVFWITRIFLGTFWRPSQFPCVNTINDAGSMEVA